MFFKIDVLKNFPYFTGKNLCWILFPIKVETKTPTQMCSCEICEIFMNSFFLQSTSCGCFWKFWEMSLLNKFFPGTKIMSLFIYFKISQNSQVNACAGVSFLKKIADWRSPTLLNRNSSTVDFLWILQNSQHEHFYRKNRITASGNDPGESLVFWGNSLRHVP